MQSTNPLKPYTNLLKRPEAISLLTAVVVTVLTTAGVPQAAGLPLPEAEVGLVVTTVWAVFLGFLVEGKYRGVDYGGGLRQFIRSKKVQTAFVTILVVLAQSALKLFGYELPEEALTTLVVFALAAIGGMTGIDSWQAMRLNTTFKSQ